VKILVSNDDGVSAPGLHQLASALKRLGEVYICAPEGPRSGASSSLTLYSPLHVTEVGRHCWSVSGNPRMPSSWPSPNSWAAGRHRRQRHQQRPQLRLERAV